jgi:hypothetical protein
MCRELGIEFVNEVTSHAALHYLRYHEPEYLPPIDLRDENRRRRYEEGRLHHLSQSVYVPMAFCNNKHQKTLNIGVPVATCMKHY